MKVDGLTLLDNTTVTRALSENVGEAFPLNPTDKDTWELKSPIIGYAAGIYIYSVGLLDWFPQNRTESNPNDIAVYLADKPRSNSDVCNINVVRTIYIEPDFAGSLATCRDVATTDTLMNIGVVRNGVLTPLAVLTFKAGATVGIIDTFPPYDSEIILIAAGDQLLLTLPGIRDATLADLSLTFLANLVTLD